MKSSHPPATLRECDFFSVQLKLMESAWDRYIFTVFESDVRA